MQAKVVKVKAGMQILREELKDAIVKKQARVFHLIVELNKNKYEVTQSLGELDATALELRHLAFQLRHLRNAKRATEEV